VITCVARRARDNSIPMASHSGFMASVESESLEVSASQALLRLCTASDHAPSQVSVLNSECSLDDLFGVYLREAAQSGVYLQRLDQDASIFHASHLQRELNKLEATQLQLPELKETNLGNSKPAEPGIAIGDDEFVTPKKSGVQKKPAARKSNKSNKKRFELPAGRGDKWR